MDDLEAVVAGLRAHGAELVREIGRYTDPYLLRHVRGPWGIAVELTERVG